MAGTTHRPSAHTDPAAHCGTGAGAPAAHRADGGVDPDGRKPAALGTQDPGTARGDRPFVASAGAARPPGRAALEPPAGGTGPRVAAPGNSPPARGAVTRGRRGPDGNPGPHLPPSGYLLGRRGGGAAGEYGAAGVADHAGRRAAGGSRRHRPDIRRLAEHRARTGARPRPLGGRSPAARTGGSRDGDSGRPAAAADRSGARRRLAGHDAGARGARGARHGDPGLRPLPRRAGRSAGHLALR